MADLVITPSGGSAVTYLAATQGFYRSAGRYWGRVVAQDIQYSIEDIGSPAVDGTVTRRHGARHRDIESIEIIYIDTTKQLANDRFYADETALKNKNLSVVVPDDDTYENCELVYMKKRQIPKDTGASTFRLHVLMFIRQKRPL